MIISTRYFIKFSNSGIMTCKVFIQMTLLIGHVTNNIESGRWSQKRIRNVTLILLGTNGDTIDLLLSYTKTYHHDFFRDT